ncbi:branched-chain amino acid ABC transporter substrate-binding protein [Phycicoccus sonneratiae]|uniref:Branched-chain amino acid ABC transporter substrate-binding protein n=1 Tax=Phycicoccus sonneratiae TaxID=2807628 RepID=A0ABS2CIA3_9MICO|nr:branched-chain amino acid ABC transporter substrate-binding protein [Phycicoccus sonneraticus]MBM6399520.1 branched-chain amino acid ABC transporter substrate-binding protein [Phycicoccus sonneraticus]
MPQRSVVAVGASLLVASLALTGCGTRGGDDGGDTGGGSGDSKVAKIGVIAPLSGDLAALGKGIEHSVDLAIKQANESNAIPGWKLELAAEDDQATPDVGKNAATKLASDKEVVGVVGTLNSSVAQSVQPVLAAANITQVSPANTNPSLTQGADFATAPKRAYPTYFRTCTTDSIQGPFAARYLFEKAGIKEVATVHDKKTYGQGLVDAFTKEYTKLGGKVVSAQTINPDDDKYDAVISKIKPSNPKAVYYGGEFPQAGPFSQQMKAAGLNVPLMGGDGIFSGEYVKLAGSTATGDLATSVGAPTDQLESAKSFVSAYDAAKYSEPYEAYGAYAYDAANAIINALKTSLKDADSAEAARQATVQAMSSVSFDGVTGKVAFDEYGDTTSRVLTVYQVKDGAWAPVNTEEFK